MNARSRCADARLYLIMDAGVPISLEHFLDAAIDGGVDMVQLREKNLEDHALFAYAERCAIACRRRGVPFIVNDRVDIALAAGADGVHVGQDDLPPAIARSLIGLDRIVGVSTHSVEQIDAVRDADYIGVGPIFETPTKPGRPAVGMDLIRYASSHANVPFFAIGGLEPSNVGGVISAGGSRVSVYRWIARSGDPARAAREIIAAMDAARTARAGISR